MSIRSLLIVRPKVFYAKGVVFEVPTQRLYQHTIIFGRVESRPNENPDNEIDDQVSLQFGHYEQILHRMMKKMGYELTLKKRLNFGKGRRSLLSSFVLEDKNLDYYYRTRMGLGYVTTPTFS